VVAAAVVVVEYLPQKCYEQHFPGQAGRTSRCGRHSGPKPPGSHEDYRSAPGGPLGTSDMAPLGGH